VPFIFVTVRPDGLEEALVSAAPLVELIAPAAPTAMAPDVAEAVMEMELPPSTLIASAFAPVVSEIVTAPVGKPSVALPTVMFDAPPALVKLTVVPP